MGTIQKNLRGIRDGHVFLDSTARQGSSPETKQKTTYEVCTSTVTRTKIITHLRSERNSRAAQDALVRGRSMARLRALKREREKERERERERTEDQTEIPPTKTEERENKKNNESGRFLFNPTVFSNKKKSPFFFNPTVCSYP